MIQLLVWILRIAKAGTPGILLLNSCATGESFVLIPMYYRSTANAKRIVVRH
jgi:hypothetical protein